MARQTPICFGTGEEKGMAWNGDQIIEKPTSCGMKDCANPVTVADITFWMAGSRAGRFSVEGRCNEHAWHEQFPDNPRIFVYSDAGTGAIDRVGLQTAVEKVFHSA